MMCHPHLVQVGAARMGSCEVAGFCVCMGGGKLRFTCVSSPQVLCRSQDRPGISHTAENGFGVEGVQMQHPCRACMDGCVLRDGSITWL
eukprot:242024-Chlamydomonas_euryale.AAC.1